MCLEFGYGSREQYPQTGMETTQYLWMGQPKPYQPQRQPGRFPSTPEGIGCEHASTVRSYRVFTWYGFNSDHHFRVNRDLRLPRSRMSGSTSFDSASC